MIYMLPCKHLILKRINENIIPLLTLEDIPTRWLHNQHYNVMKNVPNTIEQMKISKNQTMIELILCVWTNLNDILMLLKDLKKYEQF